ncbi:MULTISPECIES: putative entry exclusion protein TrbK-alt [Bradyrhizobium]|uniref:putative entry exclusion protein TrbK-alt n=1 Tax=Bradyrhizobium TaxID=374 RepID=UPI000D647DE0|nr:MULTISPECIES: putative entry exclusion protein TrbK-alt [Bradyrhizobium]MCA1414656.1 putative entry exclusion protein TrbK-alt [Bradyrhizobium sp. NBAIM20]MCA1465764.1 putative entry exclusion protein TrbK-alt [Bradyrhizobium sp. NBAIM18]MCA1530364.1 putative entry exclusion protein TrbK-alt [Bradyrhizobium yuanmingense]
MERSDVLRAGAMIVVFAIFLAALHVIHRRPAERPMSDAPPASTPDDLSAELLRCAELGPQDAEDAHCQAVWKENRARFFGRPARPILPQAAPATQPMTGAPEGEKR